MSYFLRFTDTANEDLERGTSLLDLPSLDTPQKLDGLCGYCIYEDEEIEYNLVSKEEIEEKINMYKQNTYYPGEAVIFQGDYIEQNPNGEGVIFTPNSIYEI